MQHANARYVTDACPLDRAFRFHHGAVAGSLRELADVLRYAPEWVLAHHRGHLHPWIEQVVADGPLARRFRDLEHGDAPLSELRSMLVGLLDTRIRELAEPAEEKPRPQARRIVRRRIA